MKNPKNYDKTSIEVTACISLGCGERHGYVKAVIHPDAGSLLSQVQTLTERTCAYARTMMFVKVANRFNGIAKAGIYPEDAPEVVKAHASFIVGDGIMASIQGVAIDLANPSNAAEMLPFEQKALEQAEKALVMYLLAAFSYGKEALS